MVNLAVLPPVPSTLVTSQDKNGVRFAHQSTWPLLTPKMLQVNHIASTTLVVVTQPDKLLSAPSHPLSTLTTPSPAPLAWLLTSLS